MDIWWLNQSVILSNLYFFVYHELFPCYSTQVYDSLTMRAIIVNSNPFITTYPVMLQSS